MTEQITFNVVKAKELADLTFEGKRIMHLHYFIKDGNEWLFRWIDADTDAKWLNEQIEAGKIYLFDKD